MNSSKTTFFCCCILLSQIAVARDVTITFDLKKPTGIASGQGSGFLHSLSGTEPPDSFIDPLKIKFWRGACFLDEALYRRLQRTDAVIQYVLSDGFQHPTESTCLEQKDTDRWPFQNPDLWQNYIESEARRITSFGWKVIWEPWNEPDYWPGEQNDEEKFQQYLDAFLQAYKRIKKVDPKAQFAGPSLSADTWQAARQRLVAFLQFCARHKIEVTNLTWHGFDDTENIHKYPERIREIRDLAAKKYPSVKVQRIVISEIVAKRYSSSPGDLVTTLKYLDDAGADLVGRTCHTREDCWLPQLDGSVEKGQDNFFHPTPLWWANFWYATSVGQRYSGLSSANGIVASAIERKGEIVILLGFSRAMGSNKPKGIVLNLDNLLSARITTEQVERLPELKSGFLDAPIKITDFTISKEAKRTVIRLPMIQPGDAYLISLKSPTNRFDP